MAAINRLRLFVAVPEVYSRAAQNGAKASLTLGEFPGATFTGTLVRNSNSIRSGFRGSTGVHNDPRSGNVTHCMMTPRPRTGFSCET
jgi:hypothetical protein